MPDWPDKNEALIEEFLDQLGYAPHNRWVYRSMLRHFQRYISNRRRHLSVPSVESWVKASARTISLPCAIQRVVSVKRFLDWLVERGIVPKNPFTQLREQFECSSTAAIARALVQPDSASALEALRPPPRYASHLGQLMREHVQRMRVLGMRYSHEDKFVRFDLYLQERAGAENESFAALARDYVAAVSSPATKVDRLRVTRVVAKALQREGIAVAEPARDRLLIQEVTRRRVRPYIYSVAEIEKLLETARNYGSSTAPLRSAALYCMVTLAYCAGLRLGELAGLQMKDVDLDEHTIEIRDTKFFKSRILPLSFSSIAVVRDYLIVRSEAGSSTHPDALLFCHPGGGYSRVRLGQLLRKVIRLAGLNTITGRGGPRLHDLRHTFVVHRMTQWYQRGINPQSRLQHLATYLGHRDIHSTLVYLTITQELLQQANQRFRAAETDVLKVIQGAT